jgi:hypothetical protein
MLARRGERISDVENGGFQRLVCARGSAVASAGSDLIILARPIGKIGAPPAEMLGYALARGCSQELV